MEPDNTGPSSSGQRIQRHPDPSRPLGNGEFTGPPPSASKPEGPEYSARGWLLPIFLLLATLVTATINGVAFESSVRGIPVSGFDQMFAQPELLLLGLPYSLSLILILGCHEMGHYLACVRYRIAATPPYFLPSPLLIGTFGAFIRIKAPIHNRKALFDIGVAGPLAGFVIAVPILIIGIATSGWIPETPGEFEGYILGDCLATLALVSTVAPPPPAPDGFIFAFGGMAMAGWVGLLATAMNLLPVGQLDGGHMAYAVSPKLHLWTSRICFGAFLLLGILVHEIWLFWATLLILFNPRHPRLMDESMPLSTPRLAVAAIGVAIFLVSFIPSPLRIVFN